jgi:hypothetical protein
MLFILFLYVRYLIIAMISMGERICFYEEDMIGCIALNFEIISYKILFDMFYLSLGFSRYAATPNFTSI